ncbi:MAG: BCCT family transporter, partial [Eubacterium sp.]
FVTLAESMTLSISAMTLKQFKDEKGEAAPPKLINIFWGAIMAIMAYVLLMTGGIDALQTSVIVCGLPISVLMIFMMASFYRSMKNLKTYDLFSGGDLKIYNDKENDKES